MMMAFMAVLSVVVAGGAARNVPLDGLPRVAATATFHGLTLRCEGPRLDTVLASAGVAMGEGLRGEAMRRVAVAEGADGYRVAFGLGEVDPMLGNAVVVVADRCDGRAVDRRDGPLRLVADGDRRGARALRNLMRVTVVDAGGGK